MSQLIKASGQSEQRCEEGVVTQLRVIPTVKRRAAARNGEEQKQGGLSVIESCLNHSYTPNNFLRDLPKATLVALEKISSTSNFPREAVLFIEGEVNVGVFIIREGRVKLSACSADGRSIILRIVGSGEPVGLPSCISGKPYEATAEAIEPTEVSFVRRDAFVQFLRDHSDAAVRAVQLLSDIYYATYRELLCLGLYGSTSEKLARFLLDLASGTDGRRYPVRLNLTLTHQQIGQSIGASRETVTRLFTEFKRKHLITVKGSNVILLDRPGLQKILGR